MIISHQHKFIFIKTRKTAGSSIEKYLVPYLGPNDICTGSEADGTPRLNTTQTSGHLGWNYFRKKHRKILENYFTFAVERNPWDKMVSHYHWTQKIRGWRARDGFENFVVKHCDKYNDWDKYSDPENNIKVKKLIKYENLHQEFLNLPIPYNGELLTTFVKSGIRKNADYQRYYSNRTKKLVEEVFANVIDHFEYTF